MRLLLAAFFAARLGAQTLGTISGTVISATSGAALASSTVVLGSGDGSPLRTILSDRRGRYVFDRLQPGYYTVHASRPSYAQGRYGQKAWNEVGRPIELGPGAGFSADIVLHRLGVIAGLVTDENGEGLPNITLNAIALNTRGRVAASGMSDDRGAFRIPGLKPGRYYVATGPKVLEDGTGLLPTYAPAFLDRAESRVITVQIDQETADVRLQPLPGKLLRLSGTAPAASGAKNASLLVRLVQGEYYRQVSAGPDGEFSFADVIPGRYTLTATLDSGETHLAGYRTIEIYNDLEGLSLDLAAAPQLQARVVDENNNEVNDPQFMIFLGKADEHSREGPLRVERRSSIPVAPGRWRLFVISPETHVVESASVEDSDGLEGFMLLPGRKAGATIRVARRAALVRGRATSADGRAARGVSVICYPLDSQNQRRLGGFRSIRSDLNGEYRFGGLPAGEYLFFATTAQDPNPDERLDEFKSRTPVIQVSASSETTRDIRVLE